MTNDNTYKYYLLADTVPIRVKFNRGLKIGAEIPDSDKGDLVLKMDMLSRIENSPEVEEINITDFELRCRGVYSKKRLVPFPGE